MENEEDIERKSFLIHRTYARNLKELDHDKAGRLFKAICEFNFEGSEPDFSEDVVLRILFNQVKDQHLLEFDKYKKIVNRNRKNSQNSTGPKSSNKTGERLYTFSEVLSIHNDTKRAETQADFEITEALDGQGKKKWRKREK